MSAPKILCIDIETRLTLASRAGVDPISGCWNWGGSKDKDGYGLISQNPRRLAHRESCALNGLPTETKPFALHRCNNKSCINPGHLYWGNDTDNARDRKRDGTARGSRCYATHCIRGHEFVEDNIYWDTRWYGKNCKECRRDAVRRMRARKAAAQ